MTYVSAPDIPALDNPMTGKAAPLYEKLDGAADVPGRLAGSPAAPPEDKVTLVWRCYEEADAQRVLVDQSEPARPFSSPLQAVSNLLKFVVAALGLAAVFGLFSQLLRWPRLAVPLRHLVQETVGSLHTPGQWLAVLGGLLALAFGILFATTRWNQKFRKDKGARGLPVLAVGSWLPLQIAVTLPLLLFLFATFLFRTWLILLAVPLSLLCVCLHWGLVWPLTGFAAACLALACLQNACNISVRGLFTRPVP